MLSLLFFCRISGDKRKGLCCSGKFGTIQQNSVRKDGCDVEVYEGRAHHAAGRRVLGLVGHVQSIFVLRTGNGYAAYIIIPQCLMRKWGSILPVGMGMLSGGIACVLLMRIWTIPVSFSAPSIVMTIFVVLVGTALAFTAFLQGTANCRTGARQYAGLRGAADCYSDNGAVYAHGICRYGFDWICLYFGNRLYFGEKGIKQRASSCDEARLLCNC